MLPAAAILAAELALETVIATVQRPLLSVLSEQRRALMKVRLIVASVFQENQHVLSATCASSPFLFADIKWKGPCICSCTPQRQAMYSSCEQEKLQLAGRLGKITCRFLKLPHWNHYFSKALAVVFFYERCERCEYYDYDL